MKQSTITINKMTAFSISYKREFSTKHGRQHGRWILSQSTLKEKKKLN